MPEAALAVEALEVRYDGVPAVRGIDLELARGEIVGLVGPNGAGKSSMLHAVMGVVPAAAGDVRLAGRSIRGLRPEEIARAGVALVPEGRHVYASLTVEENLRLGFAARRDRTGLVEDVAWVHELFPILKDFAARNAGALSGGQQQQLAIARALVARPDVLLLDEPSLGLAPTIVERLFETLGGIRDRGVSILLVEQRAQLTIAFADRTHVMANGALRLTLGPHEAGDTERLTAAYLS
ncbi:MAG TPA: ABC transporter ATP-binding protein [Gaiellaceae bacterium]|jgi:branched-chain amino acid transport system ATP-binding protein|nr:ABC transporter ATP-binding protein [Gaiellaceae bacterium]